MQNKRNANRHKIRYAIKFGIHKPLLSAFTEDISAHGLFLRTSIVAPVGTRILIDLTLPNTEKVSIAGAVRWVEKGSSQNRNCKNTGIGIEINRIISGEEQFRKLIAELKAMEIHQAHLFCAA